MRRAAVIVVVALGAVALVLLLGGFLLAGIDEAVGSYPGDELLRAWIRAGKSSWWLRVVVDVAVGLLLLGGVVWYVLEWFDLFGSGFGSGSRRSESNGD